LTRAALLLLFVAAATLLSSAPALAIGQRGHVFSFSFGATGKGAGQLNGPSGIAVNNATGNVYVADSANNRVEEFKPELNSHGELVGETFVKEFAVPFPQAVAVDNNTSKSDPSKGDVYVVGTTKEGAKEAEPEDKIVYKFSENGELIAKLSKYKPFGKGTEAEELEKIEGIAVDPNPLDSSGFLYVYQENGKIDQFNSAEKPEGASSIQSQAAEGRPGLAIDSEHNFYVGAEAVVGADPFEEELTEQLAEEGEHAGAFPPGGFDVVAQINGLNGQLKVPELDAEYTPAVAVNPQSEPANEVSELNDVYLANVAVVAGEDATTIAAFSPPGPSSPHGSLIQRFSAPGLKRGEGIAVSSKTGAVYVADAKADKVDVFGLVPRGLPTVGGLSACTLESSSEGHCPKVTNATTLKAQVNPSGADTSAWFEYGAGTCATVPSPCTATEKAKVGAGFADQGASVELPNLPTGTYHYRVVASNEFGTVRSAEQTFTILASASGLPDARAWEMVSPPKKNGAEPESLSAAGGVIQASTSGNAIAYIGDGPMPAEGVQEGNRAPEYTQVLSARGSKAWTSQDITTPNDAGTGLHAGIPPEYQAFSLNLALGLVQPFGGPAHSGSLEGPPLSPPLPAEEGHQEKTIYLRHDAVEELLSPGASEAANYAAAKHNGELMNNPGYLAVVSRANSPGGAEFGGAYGAGASEGVEFSGATPDLSHVVLASHRAVPGIYEWGPEETLQLVSELPGKTRVAPDHASLGGLGGRDARHAISNNGSRVFWTTAEGGTTHLYVRDTKTQETLRVDTVQPGASGAGEAGAVFQTASADGSKVFFTDTQRLTPDSKAGNFTEKMPDLYVLELSGGSAPGDPLASTLKDLTPEGTQGESAAVQVSGGTGGGVLGASEDGSYVYFVANGALSPDASRGHCSPEEQPRPQGTTCNLYERHYNGTEWTPTKLIAALSKEDSPDWGGAGQEADLSLMTARVSPNGQYLAFMSNRSLTGYDNEDVTSKAEGERLDEEVFLYSAGAEHLVCASCNPTGARPKGVQDVAANYEGEGLVVDRAQIWDPESSSSTDHWLAGNIPGWTPLDITKSRYQSRYLSDNGRLYFNSPDALVPAATGSKEKVYQYEPNGLGSCHDEGGCVGLISSGTAEHESAFLDASLSGNDVFYLTAEKLVQQDRDESFDVYDAHVCEPSSPCLPAPAGGSPPCKTADECRLGASSSPAFAAPASTSSSGSGNAAQQQVLSEKVVAKPKSKPLTRAQKLANALRTCRKIKQKSKRVACEKQARKKYGPTKSKKAGKSSGKGKAR
jgi:DNA-binding beta-propeller fold protein YncE